MIVSTIKLFVIVLHTIISSSLIILCSPFDSNGKMYQKLARYHARGTLKLAGVSLAVEGLSLLDSQKSYVYVSNHASLLDIPVVLAAIPYDIRIIYKKELHYFPIFGWGLKLGRTYIPIDRRKSADAMRSLEEALKKIRGGASILLFAEGTRTTDGKLQPFKRGPFNLAMKATTPVVPVTINGTYNILKKGSFRLHPGKVTVIIDTPVEVPGETGRENELELREQVHRTITKNYRMQ
jgi:1-acyl-sn-glycerol-3-phosphate acyltransferase